jgi:hypothetical protein
MIYVLGGLLWVVIAVAVVVVFLQRKNRPTCPSCGLSVDRDLSTCPYCGATM